METLAVFQLFVYAHHPHPFFNFLSFFNLCSVVIAVSGKINFTALLCREFNLFLRISLHLSLATEA